MLDIFDHPDIEDIKFMAIWQLNFALVPILDIKKNHGHIVNILYQYQAHIGCPKIIDENELINYWVDIDISEDIIGRFAQLLPPMESWSENAVMFGTDEGNKIEVWNDDIYCSIDMRKLNLNLLESILHIAEKLKCMVVLEEGGIVIEPSDVIPKLRNSTAYKFCLNPIETIISVGKQPGRLD